MYGQLVELSSTLKGYLIRSGQEKNRPQIFCQVYKNFTNRTKRVEATHKA